MNCALEHRGQVQDGVVGRWLREVGKIGIGQDGIAVVQGCIGFADVVDRCAVDYTSLLQAGLISGACFLRFLERGLHEYNPVEGI